MQVDQQQDDGHTSPSVSVAGARHHLPEPESDFHSDDQEETTLGNGAGAKRKRPISVS